MLFADDVASRGLPDCDLPHAAVGSNSQNEGRKNAGLLGMEMVRAKIRDGADLIQYQYSSLKSM